MQSMQCWSHQGVGGQPKQLPFIPSCSPHLSELKTGDLGWEVAAADKTGGQEQPTGSGFLPQEASQTTCVLGRIGNTRVESMGLLHFDLFSTHSGPKRSFRLLYVSVSQPWQVSDVWTLISMAGEFWDLMSTHLKVRIYWVASSICNIAITILWLHVHKPGSWIKPCSGFTQYSEP